MSSVLLWDFYANKNGNLLSTFLDNLSVPFSRFKPLKMGQIGCTETSVQNYHSTLHEIPEERRFQFRIIY